MREQLAGPTVDALQPVMSPEQVAALRRAVRQVHVADAVLAYAVSLDRAHPTHPLVAIGASTRATIALVRCAQARTF